MPFEANLSVALADNGHGLGRDAARTSSSCALSFLRLSIMVEVCGVEITSVITWLLLISESSLRSSSATVSVRRLATKDLQLDEYQYN